MGLTKSPAAANSTDDAAQSLASALSSTVLMVVFFLSGFSALLYQVAWQRLLTVHYGVGNESVTTIVAIYMLGLGLGSLVGGIISRRNKSLIAIYIMVEAAIAMFGLVSLPMLSFLGTVTSAAHHLVTLAAIFCFLCLPTMLMGITLPILTAVLVRMKHSLITAVSALYGFNTMGAALGALLAAYGLISFGGLDTTVYVAASINLALAAIVFLFFNKKILPDYAVEESGSLPVGQQLGYWAYVCVFITGFIAIGYEIAWFRTVELLVKASPYAFATVLAVYLTGIACGSWLMNQLLNFKVAVNRITIFLSLQIGISVYSLLAYTGFYFAASGPLKQLIASCFNAELHPPVDLHVFHSLKTFCAGWFTYFDVLIWPVFFMLVPTILMGASFPLVSSLANTKANEAGKTVGTIYFFNILGNVLGALTVGFVFLGGFGTAKTILILAIMALPFLLAALFRIADIRLRTVAAASCLVVGVGLLFFYPSSNRFIASIHSSPGPEWRTYIEEGPDSVVVTYENGDKIWHYINGLAHGGKDSWMYGYYRQAVDGISFCKAKAPEKILVVGYGTGSLVDGVLRNPEVKRVTVVELNQSVIENLQKIDQFKRQFVDPRVEIVIDDGRRYLNRTDQKFDAIFMDPLRSTTAYSNNIYSANFIRLVQSRLADGGVLTLWLDDYLTLPKTVASVFPHIKLFSNFCVASSSSLELNSRTREKMLGTFTSVEREKIEQTNYFIADRPYLLEKAAKVRPNTDLKPRCEYYLGLDTSKEWANIPVQP